MATPSQKGAELEDFLERLFSRTTKINANVCTVCDGPATEFRDSLSRKEYTISGLCQQCQDKAFEEPSEDDEGWTSEDDDSYKL